MTLRDALKQAPYAVRFFEAGRVVVQAGTCDPADPTSVAREAWQYVWPPSGQMLCTDVRGNGDVADPAKDDWWPADGPFYVRKD